MSTAAKHFDPQLGIDIHMYAMPTFPLPTPHIGLVLDPFDYLPFLGATVTVNGVKRATAGTGGLDIHIPLGMWTPQLSMPMGPQFDGEEIFMGSKTVTADGDPFSRLAAPVLDCNLAGLIPPFRINKLKKPFRSLWLPTGINVAIPTNVKVGGPLTISLMAMLFHAAFAGLGALRRSKLGARAADAFKGLRQRVFKNMDSGFLKCKVLRAEPVDIRDGSVSVLHEDFAIPGRLPLTWTRRYSSAHAEQAGVCGHGWQTPGDIRLEIEADGVVLFHDGRGAAVFPQLPDATTSQVREFVDGARLSRDGTDLLVRSKDGMRYRFADLPAAGVAVLPRARSLPIAQVEDACGNHWRFERRDGHLVRVVESGADGVQGRFIEVEARHGRIDRLQLHDPATGLTHPLVAYRYTDGDLVAAEDALGAPRRFVYRQHRLLQHTDRVGLSFYYDYDRQWRVVHSWGDGGLYDYRFAYDDLLRETAVTDSLGHVSLVKFDENRLPLCEIDPLDGVTVFAYDAVGRTVAVTDPEGLCTRFDYDDCGNLLTLTRPDGSTLRQTFDDDDRLIAVADPDGHAWQQRHDARGLLVEQTDPLGATAQYVYDDHGQLRAHTNARGATTRLEYDRYGLLAALIDALGHRSAFAHDALGRRRSQHDPLGHASTYEYDAKGRLVRLRSPGGGEVQCEYDAEDQLVRYVDEAGAQTRLQYVGIGQIGKRLQADGHTVEYRYDSEEQLVAVINQRGERYELKRDALGRIVEEVDYWGQARRYDYDASGRLTATHDPLGQRIAYATDPLGRIVRKTLADVRQPGQQLQEHFVYDRRGQLVELRNPHRSATRRFDALGQLLEEVQDGFRVGYGYDAVGNRVLRETSAGNRVAFGYDLRDQVVSVAINDDAPILIERDALGRATREQLSAQVERRFAYDGRSLLTAQAVLKDAVPLFETHYDYDRAGNLTHRRDSVQGVDEYRYDAIGRLLQHTDPKGKIERFFNDPAGDRLATRVQQVQLRKVVGGDEQQVQWTREGTYEGVHYVFDRAGDLIRKGSPHGPEPDDLELCWDPNHRLAESRKAGQVTHYGYDPLGRRVFKRNPTHTTWFYWDGDALLGEVKHANDDPDAAPVWIGNVANLIEVKRRKEKLAKLHERVREYVYYPGTFVPLGLIEKEPQGRSTSALAEQTNESIPSIHVAASPPEVIVASSNTSFKPVAKPSGSMGVLGRGAKAGDQSSLEVKGKGNKNGFPALGKMVLGSSLQEGVSLSSAASGVKVNAVGSVESIESNGDVNAAFKESQGPESLGAIAYLYCVDVNGCPRRILKENGDIVWSASYSVVGAAQPDGWGLLENNIRLQGQYLDSETGLNYNRHRYYDYQSAQFISNDSLRLAAGENLYFYAPNNQVWADPLGLHSIQVTYGSTDLSEMAQLHRMDMGITGGQNVAVFEYLDENGMPNYISQASGDGLHAERRINAQLQKMGIPAENVKRVYSELAPCPEVRGMQYCGRMLENSYPNAQVTHSFEYGASRESRRKGVKELKAAVKKFFTGCDG
ncbi:type IV secretion protein Rhs [Xanthomonas oryzae pv. oryzicola]|uniref:nucleic acid/nucleotide deaminase domain-containing protein n=3 Tax=Xanthomonas oryzae TaxID=347 RepID=UPI000655E22C|nr:nucleic acid/nucleotide deaminase domain-containing protein [Xanthomonas oryzae]AKN94243.1 type IV secretion protein Rhs [Xanthomonas oryzae pv. oryzicola]AKN97968.1 type IV secretion protein Rhs [Xanthomonas oryzae pv. oryzicola]AKO13193.1 type IV secretion protein Rhs [Xanthomonas oryzae pv. oryzicola]AKO16933.1 type IV secretion protein Rhs [Xanthomonas oryzae pv. oryzicola]